MIWSEELDDFKLCRRVYGRVMGVGVRKQRPALKDISSLNNPSGLSDDDVINCVDIEPRVCLGLIDVPDDVPSSIYEKTTHNNCIQFSYDPIAQLCKTRIVAAPVKVSTKKGKFLELLQELRHPSACKEQTVSCVNIGYVFLMRVRTGSFKTSSTFAIRWYVRIR